MKQDYYAVKFKNGKTVYTKAFNSVEAHILTQAFMIKNAFSYEVASITKVNGLSAMKSTDYLVG